MMGECWNSAPVKRPTFSELVTVISTSLEGTAGYLDFTSPSLTTELPLNIEQDQEDEAYVQVGDDS